MVAVQKAQPGGDSFGNQWPTAGTVLDLPLHQAEELCRIPYAGFRVVDDSLLNPAPLDPAVDPAVIEPPVDGARIAVQAPAAGPETLADPLALAEIRRNAEAGPAGRVTGPTVVPGSSPSVPRSGGRTAGKGATTTRKS